MFHRQNQIAAAYDRSRATGSAPSSTSFGGAYRDIADNAPRTGLGAPPGYYPGAAFAQQARWQQATGEGDMTAPPGWDPTNCNFQYCCPTPPVGQSGSIRLVGLPDDCIEACECGHVIETEVCAPLSVIGLFVPETIARCLSMTRFRVGCSDLLLNCDPVCVELFSCCEIDENLLGGVTVAAGTPICLTFDNKCKADIEFCGTLKVLACVPCQ